MGWLVDVSRKMEVVGPTRIATTVFPLMDGVMGRKESEVELSSVAVERGTGDWSLKCSLIQAHQPNQF